MTTTLVRPHEDLTRNHEEEWLQCFDQYAVGKHTKVDDNKIEAFWEELKDLPMTAVVQACQELKRTPGPFITDPGTWFRIADDIAAKMLRDAAEETANTTTAPAHVEHEEQERIREARDAYVVKLEGFLGHPLSPTNVLKRKEIQLPRGYACLTCHDTGWAEVDASMEELRLYGPQGGQTTVKRCHCFYTNPTLLAERSRYEAHRAEATRSRIK
jgi:hypothetical protein